MKAISNVDTYNESEGCTIDQNGDLIVYIEETKTFSVEQFNAWWDERNTKILAALANSIETDLTETELQAYRQLQTYNGTTNISNDKGAGLSVKYCTNKALSSCVAPITTDLQKQIDQLKAAILSLGGNV